MLECCRAGNGMSCNMRGMPSGSRSELEGVAPHDIVEQATVRGVLVGNTLLGTGTRYRAVRLKDKV